MPSKLVYAVAPGDVFGALAIDCCRFAGAIKNDVVFDLRALRPPCSESKRQAAPTPRSPHLPQGCNPSQRSLRFLQLHKG